MVERMDSSRLGNLVRLVRVGAVLGLFSVPTLAAAQTDIPVGNDADVNFYPSSSSQPNSHQTKIADDIILSPRVALASGPEILDYSNLPEVDRELKQRALDNVVNRDRALPETPAPSVLPMVNEVVGKEGTFASLVWLLAAAVVSLSVVARREALVDNAASEAAKDGGVDSDSRRQIHYS